MANDGANNDKRRRVCDHCIRQKVKCDLRKPQCSRCIERELTCVYSTIRRKPGPAPGSRRGGHGARSSQRETNATSIISPSSSGSYIEPSDRPFTVLTAQSETLPIADAFDVQNPSNHGPEIEVLRIDVEEERLLATWYFQNIHHAIPLFVGDAEATAEEFAEVLKYCSPDLLETIKVVSAKLSRLSLSDVTEDALQEQIDRLLGSSSLREDIAGNSASLDHFRQSCILAFYEYHQCPGQQAWMRVGKLVRSAYWIGLDRIETLSRTAPLWMAIRDSQIEEWRLVWWCIFCLDSYANVATGMPYGIDERLINTALPRGDSVANIRRMVLPYEPDDLVHMLRDLLAEFAPKDCALEIRIISITMLRHVGRAMRFHEAITADKLVQYIRDTESRLYALRLALPANFFNPRRNAFANESTKSQHFRLITMHHIIMAQMLISVGHCRRLPEGEEWLEYWQQVLELCQNVSDIAKQWNTSYCLSVDPALTIIAFVSLIFLDLQHKFAASRGGADSLALQNDITQRQTILMAFLESFAEFWTLPRLLILSYKGFKAALPSPLFYGHVQAVLRRFESPLHPRWLTFLQSAEQILDGQG